MYINICCRYALQSLKSAPKSNRGMCQLVLDKRRRVEVEMTYEMESLEKDLHFLEKEDQEFMEELAQLPYNTDFEKYLKAGVEFLGMVDCTLGAGPPLCMPFILLKSRHVFPAIGSPHTSSSLQPPAATSCPHTSCHPPQPAFCPHPQSRTPTPTSQCAVLSVESMVIITGPWVDVPRASMWVVCA